MKLATFVYQGSRRVGLLSDDGLRVQILDLSTQENERGILSLVDRKASGKPFPAVIHCTSPLPYLPEAP